MEIFSLVLNDMGTNTYIISNGAMAIVIDPSCDGERILYELKSRSLELKAVLLTHAHFDHCNAAAQLEKAGAVVYVTEKDYNMAVRDGMSLAEFCGEEFHPFSAMFLQEGNLELFGMKFDVIFTPGHTAGSVCFVIDNVIFSGDTLFYMSVGRSDLPTGNQVELIDSIKNKLFMSDINREILPGHGEKTTLAFEKANNPYVN